MKKKLEKIKNNKFFVLLFVLLTQISFAFTAANKAASEQEVKDVNGFLVGFVIVLQVTITLFTLIKNTAAAFKDFSGQQVDIGSMVQRLFTVIIILTIVWFLPKMILSVFGSTFDITNIIK